MHSVIVRLKYVFCVLENASGPQKAFQKHVNKM